MESPVIYHYFLVIELFNSQWFWHDLYIYIIIYVILLACLFVCLLWGRRLSWFQSFLLQLLHDLAVVFVSWDTSNWKLLWGTHIQCFFFKKFSPNSCFPCCLSFWISMKFAIFITHFAVLLSWNYVYLSYLLIHNQNFM